MANPYHHSLSSAKQWGGDWNDYIAIHDWFDASKAMWPDARHRAIRHHSQGIFVCEQVFGHIITTSAGRSIPVRWIGEQHCMEDFGTFIPRLQQYLDAVREEYRHLIPRSDEWLDILAQPLDLAATLDAYAGKESAVSRFTEWLGYITLKPWMVRGSRKLSRELEKEQPDGIS